MRVIRQNYNRFDWQDVNGIRVVVASFGILGGLTGILAGWFEILQGNIPPTGFIVSTIGPSYKMVDDFTYFAITIIPNMLVTGILAIIVSSVVIIWSIKFVNRKNGVIILLGLSITQMLVGGAWVIDLGLLMCLLATRIDKPLNWWRSHFPLKLRLWLVKVLPFALVFYTMISFSMLVLTILGVNDEVLIGLLEPLALLMFIPILLMVFGALAHDIQRQLNKE